MGDRGSAVVLGAGDPDVQNSLDDPARVAPATTPVGGLGGDFTRQFAPQSVTIVRLTSR